MSPSRLIAHFLFAVVVAGAQSAMAQVVGPQADSERLLKGLRAESPIERQKAINEAGRANAQELVEPIAAIVRNRREVPAIREAAATALLRLDRARAVRLLQQLTDDPDENRRALEGLRLLLIRGVVQRPDVRGLGTLARLALDPTAGETVRVEAVKALAFLAPPTFSEPFLIIARDPSAPPRAREEAARELGRRAPADALAVLLPMLDEERPEIVAAVLNALSTAIDQKPVSRSVLPPDILKRFMVVLSKNFERIPVRRAAVTAIGSLRDPQAVDMLRLTVEGDQNSDVRLAAIKGLELIAGPGAFEALNHLAGSKSLAEPVRLSALDSLCHVGSRETADRQVRLIGRLGRLEEFGTEAERDSALRCLGWLRHADTAAVLRRIADFPKTPADIRALAVQELTRKSPSPDLLRQYLVPSLPESVRIAAIRGLGTLPSVAGEDAMRLIEKRELAEPPAVRLAAAESLRLGKFDNRILRRLITSFHAERDERVRRTLIATIGLRSHEPTARDVLSAVLDDRKHDLDLRRIAAEALARGFPSAILLGRVGIEKATLERVLSFARDAGQPPALRRVLIEQIGRLAAPDISLELGEPVRRALAELAKSPSEPVEIRQAALRALTAYLQKSGDPTLVRSLLELVLSDKAPEDLRVGGINVVGSVRSDAVRSALLNVLGEEAVSQTLRTAALATLLGTFPTDAEVRNATLRLARDRQLADMNLRDTAIYSLRLFAEDDAVVAELISMLEDADEGVRASAAAALARSGRAESRAILDPVAESDKSPIVRWAARLDRP